MNIERPVDTSMRACECRSVFEMALFLGRLRPVIVAPRGMRARRALARGIKITENIATGRVNHRIQVDYDRYQTMSRTNADALVVD